MASIRVWRELRKLEVWERSGCCKSRLCSALVTILWHSSRGRILRLVVLPLEPKNHPRRACVQWKVSEETPPIPGSSLTAGSGDSPPALERGTGIAASQAQLEMPDGSSPQPGTEDLRFDAFPDW